ncbi:hypothetical protein VPHD530_0011 [Vibrio phage D530]
MYLVSLGTLKVSQCATRFELFSLVELIQIN